MKLIHTLVRFVCRASIAGEKFHDGGSTKGPSSVLKVLLYSFIVIELAYSGAARAAGSTVTIKNVGTGLCVDTLGSTGFSLLYQEKCSGANSQNFTLNSSPESGYSYIESAASSLCWDTQGGSKSAGTLIQQYTCVAAMPEYFELSQSSAGVYTILSASTNCIDVTGSSAGSEIKLNTCNGTNTQLFQVTAPGVSVSITPTSVSVPSAGTQQFTSTVTGSTNTAVTWSASAGSISTSGKFTAPTCTSNMSVTVTATSQASTSSSASAAVTIDAPASAVSVSITPTSATVASAGTQQFTATVTGSTNTAVTWTTNDGSISSSGLYTAPTVTANTTATITATSQANSADSASATVTVDTTSSVVQVNVQSYGATGNGTTDDTAAINKAIAALQTGYELYFPCPSGAYYLISSGLTPITSTNAIVAGQTGCSGGTVTLHSKGSGSTILQIGNNNAPGAETPITALAEDMSTTFQADLSAIGAEVGSYVYLEETVSTSDTTHTACGGSGCRGEVLQITGISGTTATVATAVHQTYDPSCCVPWVQLLRNPVSGITVQNLTLDGSGVAYYGLADLNTVNTTVTNVTTQNIVWSGIAAVNGYNNSYNSITVTHAGSDSGGTMGGSAVSLQQQGNLNVNGMSLSSLNSLAFGFVPWKEANGTFTNVSVDGTGTGGGRLIKLNSSSHNTFNSVSTNRSEAAYYQGITIEYFSHHNVWNNCTVTRNVGSDTNAGIALYGDVANGTNDGSNHYNTFNNCTVTGNHGFAIWVFDNNNYVTINGGTWSSAPGFQVIEFGNGGPCCQNNAYIYNATIESPGTKGIDIENGSTGACINNNVFETGLSAGINVTASSDMGSGNVMNGLSSNLEPGTCSGP